MKQISRLRDETRRLLVNRPKTLSAMDIAKEVGVSVAWLNSFARGDISNPGVLHIETLNEYLKNIENKAV